MSSPQNILLWLPSPMGDAIMSTPALRAIRNHYPNATITAYANKVVQDILSPCDNIDEWLIQKKQSLWQRASMLRKQRFTHVFLFKNSFGSALTCFLARIPKRIGYIRESRGLLLSDGLKPPKNQDGTYQARPMIDYYLGLAEQQGANIENRQMSLDIDTNLIKTVTSKHPPLKETKQPLVILVPGGAFGPSKCWPAERYAQIATWLIETYKAQVAISVAPSDDELAVAEKIAEHCPHILINLGSPPPKPRRTQSPLQQSHPSHRQRHRPPPHRYRLKKKHHHPLRPQQPRLDPNRLAKRNPTHRPRPLRPLPPTHLHRRNPYLYECNNCRTGARSSSSVGLYDGLTVDTQVVAPTTICYRLKVSQLKTNNLASAPTGYQQASSRPGFNLLSSKICFLGTGSGQELLIDVFPTSF